MSDSPFLPDDDPDDLPTPWSFRIIVALAVIYLAYRLVQGVMWVAHRLAG